MNSERDDYFGLPAIFRQPEIIADVYYEDFPLEPCGNMDSQRVIHFFDYPEKTELHKLLIVPRLRP